MISSTIKLTTEQFISRAIEVHGNKYDYSLVEYVNNKTNVKLICKVHGVFEIRPDNHLGNKSGCHFCSNNMKLTTEQFINKSIEVHGNKYDYSLVKYDNNRSKIKIICQEHGIFSQEAATHLNGANCPVCSGNKKSTKEYIIISNNKHNNKYDYSLIDNTNNNTKVKIICQEHGIFIQSLSKHSKGSKCPICKSNEESSIDRFINSSKKIHDNKYDYSNVKYINKNTKVKIICNLHGEFEQTPNSHLKGAGCKKCADNSKKLNINNFIDKCNIVHNYKYDYSSVNYINSLTKIEIICPIHGIFNQTPRNHQIGRGCSICNESKGERTISIFLNNNNIKYISQYKIKHCIDKKELPFDFFLSDYNICIEYDGKQHFESIKMFGGDNNFEIIKKHDEIKTNFCDMNNIKLFRIKYNDNIDEKLILLSNLLFI